MGFSSVPSHRRCNPDAVSRESRGVSQEVQRLRGREGWRFRGTNSWNHRDTETQRKQEKRAKEVVTNPCFLIGTLGIAHSFCWSSLCLCVSVVHRVSASWRSGWGPFPPAGRCCLRRSKG